MKKLNIIAKGRKPSFGKSGGFSYAVSIINLDSNEFYKESFGRQLDDLRKIQEWKKDAKKGYVNAKGRATLSSVKQWVKDNKPNEFYAKWQSDSPYYKDDVVDIYYK